MEKSKQAAILMAVLAILTVLTVDAIIFQHVPTFVIMIYGIYATGFLLVLPRYYKVIKIKLNIRKSK